MSGAQPKKRDAGMVRRGHDRKKFRKFSNSSVKHSDITGGYNGILFSCAPRHEFSAAREGVILLSKHYEELTQTGKHAKPQPAISAMKDLDDELKDLRSTDDRPFTHLEAGVLGAVFLRVNTEKMSVSLEALVEAALRNARATGSPNSKNCVRILPIHNTCYASPERAAAATAAVVKTHFPALKPRTDSATPEPENATSHTVSTASFAIAFRARMNTGARRQDYITAIADAVHQFDDRYTVDLTNPDVTLIVEILKTNCCIGTFRHFFELAKMNLREAACTSAVKSDEHDKTDTTKTAEEEKPEGKSEDETAEEEKDHMSEKDKTAGEDKLKPDSEKGNVAKEGKGGSESEKDKTAEEEKVEPKSDKSKTAKEEKLDSTPDKDKSAQEQKLEPNSEKYKTAEEQKLEQKAKV